ncbi:MAG TPA: serine hydrolase [Candidatus Sphingobacterium stercorigallinarum]|nr:serine hydrolase [Candidatus Sphingobacterium stercorigallinarum]
MRLPGVTLFFAFLFSSIQLVCAQTEAERQNRAVFNRIEYFFNTQQTDSIYQLANEKFKEQISQTKLSNILDQLYSLGKIQSADRTGFTEGIATYTLDFETTTLDLQLGVDTNFRYGLFLIQPHQSTEQDELPVEHEPAMKDSVISNVDTKSELDLYVDSVARHYARNERVHSLSVAIIHQNKINTFFYGETQPGNNQLPDANTSYEIGSITKTFTATLLADLVNKGRLRLDESIATYLPDSLAQNPNIKAITFQMLANHTSGLPRLASNWNTGADFQKDNPYAHYTREDLFTYLVQFEPENEPGTTYEYSNLGFGLLGELLSILENKPYMQLISEHILTPLEMTNTTDQLLESEDNLAPPYDQDGQAVPFWKFQALAGAGSLSSTLNDLLRYSIAQLTYPETDVQKSMHLTKQFTFFVPPNSDIGLGWHMTMIDGVIAYYHTGATSGSNCFIGFVPDEKSVVILLSNSTAELDEMGSMMLERVLRTD